MTAANRAIRVGRLLVVLLGGALALAAGWVLFVAAPGGNLARLLGVVLALAAAAFGVRLAARLSGHALAAYDVAEVAVEGPITRDGQPSLRGQSATAAADDVVDVIEQADDDRHAEALLVRLNTPGGQVLPSEDIRLAAERFEGPVVAYATDVCASGGYWIASGCDELWAREASVVGSIGVIGSTVNASDLAERLGLSYERYAAGRYKDAGNALKEPTEDDRAYLQGLIDRYYEAFVERVTQGRDLDPETVRETEARVYIGEDAREMGLVDHVGTRESVEERLADRLDRETVTVQEFTPSHGLAERLRGGAQRVAFAAGAGVASVLGGDAEEVEVRL